MHLGGWQRLWLVVSVLSLAVAVLVVLSAQRSVSRPEDPKVQARLLASDVTIAEIAGVGEVKFPSELTKEEISANVKRGMSTTPPPVISIAEALLKERAERKAAEAKTDNEAARAENLQGWVFGIGVWIAFVVVLYLLSWAVGWVLRGFKAT